MKISMHGDYQYDAVEKLVKSFKELNAFGHKGATIIFKSPTGSGKTVMMSAVLDELSKRADLMDEFVYIWASVNSLHIQSFEKLSTQYLPDSALNMMLLENMGSDDLPANTVLFCNWESMFRIKKVIDDSGNEVEVYDNKYVRIGETGRNLQEVLAKTRDAGRKIVLIIDEAHKTYLGKNSQKLVSNVIQPDMVIEVSATPIMSLGAEDIIEHRGAMVSVKLDDVIAAGMIKNRTVINNNISGEITSASADELVLDYSLKQRELLEQKYKAVGSNIKPLVLIQLPDSKKDDDIADSMQARVEAFMTAHGITYQNQKLAIWLSDDKRNKDLVNDVNSPVEVLIFKQAIATGWDCPRAQILVMLRDIKSVTFEIQTVGRILRMPELKHYEDDDLNAAYVFTNIARPEYSDDNDTQAFFKTYISRLKPDFANIALPDNSHLLRQNRQRLGGEFRHILVEELDKEFGIEPLDTPKQRLEKLDVKLQLDPSELVVPILSQVVIQGLDDKDAVLAQIEQNKNAAIKADAVYIQRHFDLLLRGLVAPYAPHDSMNVLKSALYYWFRLNGFNDELEVQRILTCSNNEQFDGSQVVFARVMERAKQRYGKTDGETRLEQKNTFRIPSEQEFGQAYEPIAMDKHALQAYYRQKKGFNTENAFEPIMNSSPNVEWWYRNGVGEPKYFGVTYEFPNPAKNNMIEKRGFYPDYIVKFTDGRIGIFDTKSGFTINQPETKEKLRALHRYINEHNGGTGLHGTTLKLFGGIIDVRGPDGGPKTFYIKSEPDGEFSQFNEF
jgi:type III restriction enzyme